jgi:phosphohistidine phosphatase
MLLFLIRHADAVGFQEDPVRPLSLRGVDEARRLGEFFARNGAFAPAEIWHSPLQRARETAEIIHRETRLSCPVRETTGLIPEDDPALILARIAQVPQLKALALVGHDPHLSTLATLLLQEGAENEIFFEVSKGSVLAFEGQPAAPGRSAHWVNLWHVTPGLLPLPSDRDLLG